MLDALCQHVSRHMYSIYRRLKDYFLCVPSHDTPLLNSDSKIHLLTSLPVSCHSSPQPVSVTFLAFNTLHSSPACPFLLTLLFFLSALSYISSPVCLFLSPPLSVAPLASPRPALLLPFTSPSKQRHADGFPITAGTEGAWMAAAS